VVVELGEHDGMVRLVVHDDGNGIPTADRSAVLERFVRLDEARNRDAGGSGLGLAIVRKVVEGAGGTVLIDDGPLGGARVCVELPDLDPGD
jgi:signal transduction histidine kinase